MATKTKLERIIGKIRVNRYTREPRIKWHQEMDKKFSNNVKGRKEQVCPFPKI